jgi:phage repressor protein C with HTH and peptisase S24 domain
MLFNERINLLIGDLYQGNKKKFSQATGIPYTTVVEYSSGKNTDPKMSLLEKILDVHKNVNPSWLLTGSGEMIPRRFTDLNRIHDTPKEDHDPTLDFIKEEARKERQAASISEKTKSTENVVNESDYKDDYILTQNEKYRKCRHKLDDGFAVPYYEIDAAAGTDFFFNDLPEVPEDYILLPYNLKGCIAIPIHGRSMEPEYYSGDIIIIREIKDMLVIEWGTAHVVITEEQRLFKILNKGPKNTIELCSLNHTFHPMSISLEKILKLFKVEASISKKSI